MHRTTNKQKQPNNFFSPKSLGLFILLAIPIAFGGLVLPFSQKVSTTQNIVSLYTDTSSDLSSLACSAINNAKENIFIETFRLSDKKIITSVANAINRGVKVSINLDKSNKSKKILKKTELKKSISFDKTSGLMHRKVMVIDEFDIWLGSQNFTREASKLQKNVVMNIKSNGIGKFLKENDRKSIEIINKDYNITLWKIPPSSEALSSIRFSLRKCKKNIKIAMMTWSDQKLAEEVISAHKRGIKITVILDKAQLDGNSKRVVEMLNEAKVETRFYNNVMTLHHKTLIVDDEELWIGSMNWTKSGFYKNKEILIRIKFSSFSELEKTVSEIWSDLYNGSKAINVQLFGI